MAKVLLQAFYSQTLLFQFVNGIPSEPLAGRESVHLLTFETDEASHELHQATGCGSISLFVLDTTSPSFRKLPLSVLAPKFGQRQQTTSGYGHQ